MISRHKSARIVFSFGFTIPEMLAVIVILGTIAAVVTPMIVNASASYSIASKQRESVGGLNYALERTSRLFREAIPTDKGKTDITTALPGKVVFGDGSKVELIGTTLWYAAAGQTAQPLAQNISQFTIKYLEKDGKKDSSNKPDKTYRANITLASNGVELRSSVFLRETNATKGDGKGGDGDGGDGGGGNDSEGGT